MPIRKIIAIFTLLIVASVGITAYFSMAEMSSMQEGHCPVSMMVSLGCYDLHNMLGHHLSVINLLTLAIIAAAIFAVACVAIISLRNNFFPQKDKPDKAFKFYLLKFLESLLCFYRTVLRWLALHNKNGFGAVVTSGI